MTNFFIDSQTLIYASKNPSGPIGLWIAREKPFLSDIVKDEVLSSFEFHLNKLISNGLSEFLINAKNDEKAYLHSIFEVALVEERYIRSTKYHSIVERATFLVENHNIKPKDALIAATAEHFGLILVTADIKKNFAPRLEKLNREGKGNFLLQTYEYGPDGRHEQTFALWNAQAGI
jgi:predicted nucleic acid-binding protein